MKGFLAICIVAALALCCFSAFSGWKWRLLCPGCDKIQIHQSYKEFITRGLTAAREKQETKTNLSHILFGIGASEGTWNRRRHYSELWWNPNATRGYVWLDKEPDEPATWPHTSPPYKVSADTSRFKYTYKYGSRSAVRIARIVKESFDLGLDNVRWFVMGDDDTVFFTENLVSVLNKYDHREMYYIGGVSESIDQLVAHSYTMAYGGGGFAISYPLAAALVRILDGCIDRYAEAYGSDLRIGNCVSEIGVPLTKEPGFHQFDVRGNAFGLLSSHPLAPLVSLHHLDTLIPLFPGATRVDSVKKLINASKSDPSRTLQQSICYDPARKWSVSVSWGYNVQLYPFMVSARDLSTPLQSFLTWTWKQGPYIFNTRTLKLDPCRRPVNFYLDSVREYGHGSTFTWYTRPQSVKSKKCDKENYEAAYLVKGFNVSASLLDPSIWNKAPRRRCCEITSGPDQQDGVVNVRIRSCNPWESVTPP